MRCEATIPKRKTNPDPDSVRCWKDGVLCKLDGRLSSIEMVLCYQHQVKLSAEGLFVTVINETHEHGITDRHHS